MSGSSSSQPIFSAQNPKFLRLDSDSVLKLESDQGRGICLGFESMIEGEDYEETSNSFTRSGTKRVGQEIRFDSKLKSDGSSDSVCGRSREKLRAKKVRVFDTKGDKSGSSEEIGVDIEGKEIRGVESRIMGVEELSSVEEEKRILRGNEACGSRNSGKDAGTKENMKVSGLKEVVIEVKVTERGENQVMGLGIEEHRILNGCERNGNRDREEEENGKSDHVRELEKVGPISDHGGFTQMSKPILIVDDAEGEEKWDLDLNVSIWETENGGSEIGLQEYTQVGPVIAERRVETIDISSDESEGLGEKLVDSRDDRGKDKEIEKGFTDETIIGFDLDLRTMEIGCSGGGSSSASGVRRYTREEKGKAKIADSWLSLATNPTELDLTPEGQELIESAVSHCNQPYKTSQPVETTPLQETKKFEFRKELAIFEVVPARQRANRVRNREILSRHARRLAHFNPQREDYYQESVEQEQKMASMEADIDLEDVLGPFSTTLKIIREQKLKQSAQQLIKWKPSEDHGHKSPMPFVPSLLDLCLGVLAKNAEAVVSLEPVPDALKRKFTDLLCDFRKMDIHGLDLLVKGSPTEIRVKDCSWITEEQFTKTFGSFDAKNLRVLQLDLCGQCGLDDILGKTLTRFSNSLPSLGIISLRGACRLSDIALKSLVMSAPALCSINLGQCSLLDYVGINVLADSLGSILRELYIDDCQRIDAMLIVPALKKFVHLEVLSVAGIETVCDEFVSDIITQHGRNIKELDLADCLKLTDISLNVIGKSCSEICSLNISNLHKLTDLGIQYLANGCRSIQALKLCRNTFSDEAIAAFLEASGGSLKELSLNNVNKVGPNTALSLAKCSRKLLSLDLSWCRRITNEALGLIVDSCLSLKLLKLFGCTQITDLFLNGHSNSLVRIIGLNLTPVLEHVKMLESEEVLLRYSTLPLPFDSQTADHQDV